MVCARWTGSSASGASGLPCATSQKGQRRVQMSPRIMKVAVPLPKHSPMLGHEASSHTVCSFCSRRMRLMSWNREPGPGARTRIHAGLASASRGTILMAYFSNARAVFFSPFSLTPGSRTFKPREEGIDESLPHDERRFGKPERLRIGHGETGIAARVDRGKRRQVHVDVQREAMIGAAARHAYSKRGHFGAGDVDAGGAGFAL